MEKTNRLKTLLKEICTCFRDNQLQFCLAGGWAVSMIGVPRTTMDIDILIVLDDISKKKILSILKNSFNFILSHDQEMVFKTMTIWRNILSIKGDDEPYVLDLLKVNTEYLRLVITRCKDIEFEGTIIPIIAVEDLIVLKLASFRNQDQVDIENLLHAGIDIDWLYLESTITRAGLNWNYILENKE